MAAVGLASASFLSFPVASFLALGLLIVGLSSGTLAQVVEQGAVVGINHETGVADHPSVVDNLLVPFFAALLRVVNLVQDFSPIDALSTGRSVSWGQLGQAVAQIVILMGGLIGGAGVIQGMPIEKYVREHAYLQDAYRKALARQAGPGHDLAPHIAQLVELTTQELAVLRDDVSGLRNRCDTVGGGFNAALRRQVERFEALFGLKVAIEADPGLPLRGSAAKAVLHMVNEALTNVRRHTPAAAVQLSLEADPDFMVLRVRNDLGPGGAGRTPAAPFAPRSLRERTEELGGRLHIAREAGHTEITIELPMLATLQ